MTLIVKQVTVLRILKGKYNIMYEWFSSQYKIHKSFIIDYFLNFFQGSLWYWSSIFCPKNFWNYVLNNIFIWFVVKLVIAVMGKSKRL